MIEIDWGQDDIEAVVIFAPPQVIKRTGTKAVVAIAIKPGLEINPELFSKFCELYQCEIEIDGDRIFVFMDGIIQTPEEHDYVAQQIANLLPCVLGVVAQPLEVDNIEEVRWLCSMRHAQRRTQYSRG